MSTEVLEPLETEEVELPAKEPKVPQKWSDLNKPQVIAAAQAFGTLDSGTVKEMLADLQDANVSWSDYQVAFGLAEPPKEEDRNPTRVDESEVEIDWIDGEVEEDMTEQILTVPRVASMAPSEKYLIKFIGDNPYFERGRYKFTSEKPYAIMPAVDAQDALVDEPKKFRQAFPDELSEFYS
jgi:hypothetical protein